MDSRIQVSILRADMNATNRLLELLYDRGEGFFPLDDLAVETRAGRENLEASFEELTRRGHRFERLPTQGVRLVRPTVADAHLIERNLPVEHIGLRVVCLNEVDSTNDLAFASARRCGDRSLVVTAEHQRAGRGRLGRKWFSPPGSGVLAGVLLHRRARELPHEALTIAAGLAVAEGVEEATGAAAMLYWPNDVMIDGAKLSGVLVEIRTLEGRRHVVIGFGINVTAAPPSERVDRPAICLGQVVGDESRLERIEIIRAVLVRLDWWIAALADGAAAELHERWCSRCGMINTRISLMSAGQRITGRVVDVSPMEGLILMDDDGHRHRLAAETSTVIP